MKKAAWGRLLLARLLLLSCVSCTEQFKFQTANEELLRFESGEYVTETFTQGITGNQLDILFVVDNSGSMADEQARMAERIVRFLDTLHDVDWQIGITTTDVSDGPHGLQGSLLEFDGMGSKVITPSTPGALEAFQRTIVRQESIDCLPECASGLEQPLRAAMMAMDKRSTDNDGFFRNGADLGLLVLSDEDEMSNGPAEATSPAEVLNHMYSIWGDTKRLLTFGMVIVPGDVACFEMQGGQGQYGTFVTNLAGMTNGLVGSICESDYAPTLGTIAESARNLLNYVQLTAYPLDAQVEIQFSPAHSSTYRVEGRRVYFDTPPPRDTLISVSYTVL